MTDPTHPSATPDRRSGVAPRPRDTAAAGRDAVVVPSAVRQARPGRRKADAIRYRVLGQLEVVDDDGPVDLGGRRQQLVLAVLLDHAGERLSVDALIDAVWGEAPPASARKTLQSYVSRLRQGVTGDAIVTVVDGYRLDVGDELDVLRFEQLASEGRQQLDGDPAAAAALLRSALDLWRGAPYGSLGDEPALQASRQQLLERRLEVTETRITADLAAGRHDGLVAELRALVADHPLREPLHRLLMHALYLQGMQADALEVERLLRTRLADELGLEPSPAVEELQRRILDHDPRLAPTVAATDTPTGPPASTSSQPAAPPPTTGRADSPAAADGAWRALEPENPYRGLRAFGEQDATLFFGRDELVAELVEEVVGRPLVLVVGPSGSGKSSIVRAGVVPTIRRQRPGWTVVTMVPGAHPFAEFEAAMARARPALSSAMADQVRGDDLDLLRVVLTAVPEDGRVLLVVDQLEELFLLPEAGERERFVRGLVEAVDDPHGRVTVVGTIRADFLNRPLEHQALGAHVEGATVLVPPLEPVQLEAACIGPARTVGVDVAPELVTELVADVASEPGALPLFQYTLTQLFDARGDGPLTLAAYRELGGLRGSLANRADELLATLDDDAREAARQVFLRLVTIGEGTEDTRRRTRRAELVSTSLPDTAVADVLARFGEARLLSFDRDAVTGRGTVEVAHESLLREWPTLRRWIDEARGDLQLRNRLTAAAAEWEAAGRDAGFLLSGSRLAAYADASAERTLELTALEEEFLAASLAREDAALAAEEDRRRHEAALEAQARRRLRTLVAVFAVAAVVASGLGVAAVERAGDLTEQQVARELGDRAAEIGVRDPELGLLLALHAARIDDAVAGTLAPETVANLHWALQAAGAPYPDGLSVRAVDGPRGTPRGIYELEVSDLVVAARGLVDRDLTPEECGEFLGSTDCPAPLVASFGESLDGGQPPRAAASRTGLEGTAVRLWSRDLSWIPRSSFAADERLDAVALASGGVRVDVGADWDPADASDPVPDTEDIAVFGRRAQLLEEWPDDRRLLDVSTWLPADGTAPGLGGATTVDGGTSDGTQPTEVGALTDLRPTNLVWYDPGVFDAAGYPIPSTFDELTALAGRMVADGRTPWCLGLRRWFNQFEDGWHGAVVVDSLVMAEHGPDVHDAWTGGRVDFSDPRIATAFRRFAQMHLRPGQIAGGVAGAMATDPLQAMAAPIGAPVRGEMGRGSRSGRPECMMSVGWSNLGADHPGIEFFPFPPVTEQGAGAVVSFGSIVAPLQDRPEVRAVVRALATPSVATRALDSGHWSFPADPRFEPAFIGERRLQRLARTYDRALESDRVRLSALDTLPAPVAAAFQAGIVDVVVGGPGVIDEVLARIDAAWTESG